MPQAYTKERLVCCQYFFDGTAAHATVTLKYTSNVSSDLDLYVYQETHVIGATTAANGLVGASENNPTNPLAGTEVVSLVGQAAGYYMIFVNAYPTGSTSTITYYLETNSGAERLCPQF